MSCSPHLWYVTAVSALRISDGAVIVVDAAEGVMVQTDRAIRQAVLEGQPIVLVINKVCPCQCTHVP
jgi:U5 small nuclear ribonucleoprotein component